MPRSSRRRLDVGTAVLALADRLRAQVLRGRGFRSHHVPTSAGPVRILSARGKGPIPAVVALHGLASAAVDLGPLLPRLRRIAKVVVAPDLPGHGQSRVVAHHDYVSAIRIGLDEALAREIDRPVVLFGNSLGGLVALRYAAANPDRVAGLVLASPAGVAGSGDELRELLARFRTDIGSVPADLVNRVLPRGFALRRPLYAWGVGVRLRRPSIQSLLAEVDEHDLLRPSDLASLRMPILLMWGALDQLLPASHLAFFREHLPAHAVVDLIADRGHALHIEAPALVADRVLAFWQAMQSGAYAAAR